MSLANLAVTEIQYSEATSEAYPIQLAEGTYGGVHYDAALPLNRGGEGGLGAGHEV